MAETPQDTAQGQSTDRPYLVAMNIIVAIVLGVAFSIWMIRYTDWFPVVGGLLALTGVFSWIAFLSNIVSDERKAQAQAFFDRHVLQSRATAFLLVSATLLFLGGYTMTHGTLIIDTLGDESSRTGKLTSKQDFAERIAVAAGTLSTFVLPTGYAGGRNYRIKLRGLPAITAEVRRWSRKIVIAPADFWTAPVLLIRPSITMSGEANQGEFELVIEVDGAEWGSVSPYYGGSVWIGAEEDVEIPPARIDRWRAEFLLKKYDPSLVQRWTTPVSLVGASPLATGANVSVIVRRRDNPSAVQGQASTTLRPPQISAAFPQELVIDVSSNSP